MHHLMLCTLALDENPTSAQARDNVYSLLLDDDSFCGNGGRFGSPLCDWFVIGGRWSGYLRATLLGQPYQDAFQREFPQFGNGYFSTDLVERHKVGLDELWRRFGGSGCYPLARQVRKEYGADDDALRIDQALYQHFLKPFEGQSTCLGENTSCDFADLDREEVNPSFIGHKWLVVVDYHN
jgi:hypothetical protein